jgi:hypothetical protein
VLGDLFIHPTGWKNFSGMMRNGYYPKDTSQR